MSQPRPLLAAGETLFLALGLAGPAFSAPPKLPQPAVIGGPTTTTKAMTDTVGSEKKCPSLVKLDNDTALLNGDTTRLVARLNTLSNRLGKISELLAIPSDLAKDLQKIDKFMVATQKGAKLAEAVPQLEANAKKVNEAITPALAQVRAAQTKAEALAVKLAPFQKATATMSEDAAKAAKGLNTFSTVVLANEPKATQGAQLSIVHFDEPVRTCIQGKVDDLANKLDVIVVDMDKAVSLLLTDVSVNAPALVGLEAFVDKLAVLDQARKQGELLESRLEGMAKGLGELEDLLDQDYTVKIPYLVGTYKAHVSMAVIIKGSKAIEDAIEKAVSGAVWDAAKAVGLGKLVKEVVDDATHDLNKAVNSLHLNPDMNLAGLDKLQELTAMADALKTTFPGTLKLPSFNPNAPDFGLPHLPAGVDLRNIEAFARQLSPYGFGWDWPKVLVNVPDFGCK